MLSDQQVETLIYSLRLQLDVLKANQLQQNGTLNSLQLQLSNLPVPSATPSNQVTVADSYPIAGGILHKLVHTFSSNVLIQGLLNLSNALTVGNGGTGGITAAAARTNLSAAKSGANSDITSLTGLTTPLPITEGGTGQTSAGAALGALGGVASGAFPGGATVALAKLTLAGTDGSLTVDEDGIITAYIAPT